MGMLSAIGLQQGMLQEELGSSVVAVELAKWNKNAQHAGLQADFCRGLQRKWELVSVEWATAKGLCRALGRVLLSVMHYKEYGEYSSGRIGQLKIQPRAACFRFSTANFFFFFFL
jgi:hypothetical protein